MNKRAILIASVGTSRSEALEVTTYRLKQEIQEQFPDISCYVGFSSHSILMKMKEKGMECCGIPEVLEKMLEDGINEIVIQPTNLLGGLELSGLEQQIDTYKKSFDKISMGNPLLSSKEDYIRTLQALSDAAEPEEDEALVLVGHGSEHSAGNTYQNLEYTAYVQGYRNVFVGTMEEKNRNMTFRKLRASGYKRVCLMPLLFVAGYHAVKDITAESNSWKSCLVNEGYEVRPFLKGVGELPLVRKIFIEHLESAINEE